MMRSDVFSWFLEISEALQVIIIAQPQLPQKFRRT
jgi:hypothetical protein